MRRMILNQPQVRTGAPAIVALIISWVAASGCRDHSPVAVVTPVSQRIVATPGAGPVRATFRVLNRGSRDLVLGEVETSCGCSEADVQPRVIAPGGYGTISVAGDPPSAGEVAVQIRVGTNDASQSELVLQLTMVGSRPVPFVAFDTGPIRFGVVRAVPVSEAMDLETRQRAGQPPWLVRPSSSLPGLVIGGGPVEETPLGGGVVRRRYHYQAELVERPNPGDFVGEVAFADERGEPGPAYRLRVQGHVNAPAFASPAALFASFTRGDEPPSLVVGIVSDDPSFDLRADYDPTTTPEIQVRRTTLAQGRVTFEVKPRAGCEESLVRTLCFTTNHPDTPVVRIPLSFRATGP